MEQVWYKNKTLYFPLISVVLTAVLSVYLAELHDEKYYHLIIFYYGVASLYGFSAYEAAYLHKNPQHPILCSICYVLLWLPRQLILFFSSLFRFS